MIGCLILLCLLSWVDGEAGACPSFLAYIFIKSPSSNNIFDKIVLLSQRYFIMFWKKNEKLETIKDLVGSRAAYIETVKMLELKGEEKEIFLRASIEVKKKKPNIEIIDAAYEILVEKSGGREDDNTEEIIIDDRIFQLVKNTIGTSSLFMGYLNKYDFSQEERAVLSGTHEDLKKEAPDIHRIEAAYKIISKYSNNHKVDINNSEVKKEEKNEQSEESHSTEENHDSKKENKSSPFQDTQDDDSIQFEKKIKRRKTTMKNNMLRYIGIFLIAVGATLTYVNIEKNNYPYNLFDKDIYRLLDIVSQGDSSGVGIENFIRKDDGGENLYSVWGKVNTYKITKKIHVGMKAFYHITINDTDKFIISYHPNIGRTEIRVKKVYWNH